VEEKKRESKRERKRIVERKMGDTSHSNYCVNRRDILKEFRRKIIFCDFLIKKE